MLRLFFYGVIDSPLRILQGILPGTNPGTCLESANCTQQRNAFQPTVDRQPQRSWPPGSLLHTCRDPSMPPRAARARWCLPLFQEGAASLFPFAWSEFTKALPPPPPASRDTSAARDSRSGRERESTETASTTQMRGSVRPDGRSKVEASCSDDGSGGASTSSGASHSLEPAACSCELHAQLACVNDSVHVVACPVVSVQVSRRDGRHQLLGLT